MHLPGQVVILLGPPGSGKGTQGALLASMAGIPEISTGEMLRRECQSGSKLGNVIQALLSAGKLVPDDLVNQAVAHRLRNPDCENGCILDGYPRTVSQACFLDGLLAELHMAPPVTLDFRVSSEEIVARLSRRYHCAACGRTYSVDDAAQAAETVCERDGSPLLRRPDDNPATISERLRLYQANAAAIVDYYRHRTYHPICATRPVGEISAQLVGILNTFLVPLKSGTNRFSALA